MNSKFLIDDAIKISRDFDETKIQESWSWRNVSMGRSLALFLINSKGEVDRKALFSAIETLRSHLYSLHPGREYDAPRMRHLLRTLTTFYENEELIYALKRVQAPTNHLGADALIAATMQLPSGKPILDRHAKQAALAALLTPLRQNVGSCFATAPAIMIQQEQPLQFLADISQLFAIGGLRRTILGVEHSVPLCNHSGNGNLFYPIYPFLFGEMPWVVLGRAPGLIAAFKAAGLKKKCSTLLEESFLANVDPEPFFVTTADEIIRSIIKTPTRITAAISAFNSLTDNALLKAWEFTVASFAEAKADFTKWNLYASLGVKMEEPFGIGESLHRLMQGMIDQINDQIAETQSRYDHTFAQVKYLEGKLRSVTTEKELNWTRANYQVQKNELDRAINDHDRAHDAAGVINSLYPFLIKFYSEKFIDYFQEVYDAQMHDMTTTIYDDSPAGFRLLYKHGRVNTALWTLIYTPDEYIDSLCSFFIATEGELSSMKEMEGLERELPHIVTTIITTIRSAQFLENSFHRLAKTYGEPLIDNPLDKLNQIKRKPWAYTSGGTMGTLTSCYYELEDQPMSSTRWAESEMELLVFYLDTLKELPISTQHRFFENPDYSMLAFSPTHAFLLKPGYEPFRQGWDNDAYTYTWVRDHWVVPMQAFLDMNKLDKQMCNCLINSLLKEVPKGYHHVVQKAAERLTSKIRAPDFRKSVVEILGYEKWLKGHLSLFTDALDQMIYRSLPFFHESELEGRLRTIFDRIDEVDTNTTLAHLSKLEIQKHSLLSAQDLRLIAQKLIAFTLKSTRSHIAFPQKILEEMQKCGFAYPAPIIFADTNWVRKRFGFVVGPATEELELWTFDEIGSDGKPLTIWNHYLNGSSKDEWGVYTKSTQYML